MDRGLYKSLLRKPVTAVFAAMSAAAIMLSCALPAFPDSIRTFPVGPGDVLDVVVFGEENVTRALSGRFKVESDGTLYYPMLGRIDVSNMNANEIAEMLGQKLDAQIPVILSSVTIAEFAPVFLTGETARTGPFSFAPGMTVFDLVLQAGGFAGTDLTEERRARLTEELARLELDRFSLGVRKARLAAELENSAFDTGPFGMNAPADAEGIVAAERAIFEMRKRTLASRMSTYEAQKSGYDQEITSVEKNIALHDEEVRLIEEQLNARETLAQRGFAAASTLSDLKRLLTSARRDALEFRTALFRARQNRLAADRDFAERQIELDTRNVEQLREVELAIGQNEIALKATGSLLDRYRAEASATRDALGRIPEYILIRRTGGAHETKTVGEATPLQRGDVIRVSFRRADTARAASADPVLAENPENN
ncbi:MAG: polysaccharide biosynthesis/export family protein [Oricola sp.]